MTVIQLPGAFQRVQNAPSWQDDLARTQNGEVRVTSVNLDLIAKNDPEFSGLLGRSLLDGETYIMRDSKAIGLKRGHFDDDCAHQIALYIGRVHAMLAVEKKHVLANETSFVTPYHPVQKYLAGLKWDGVPRVDTALTDLFMCDDTPYVREVSRILFISAVARVQNLRGCKVDTVTILEGEQGFKKSSGIKTLVPNPDWFADTKLSPQRPKESAEKTQGIWIYELGELATFSKAEANEIKSYISSEKDRFRGAYKVKAKDVARQCIFIGTTNKASYFTDETGNRRFLPVVVRAKIDRDAIKAARDQLWAEANARFLAGEEWWTEDPSLLAAAKLEQEDRQLVLDHPWFSPIADWLNRSGPDAGKKHAEVPFSTHEVLSGIGVETPKQDAHGYVGLIGRILRALGCVLAPRKHGEQRKYWRPSVTQEGGPDAS